MTIAAPLSAAGVAVGAPLAVVMVPAGVALAWAGGSIAVRTTDPAALVREVALLDPRWNWWSARETANALVAAGVRPRACWDLGGVGRLLHAALARIDPSDSSEGA